MLPTYHLDCGIGQVALDGRSRGRGHGLGGRPCEERSYHGHVGEMGIGDRFGENDVQLEHAHAHGRYQSATMRKEEFWPTV